MLFTSDMSFGRVHCVTSLKVKTTVDGVTMCKSVSRKSCGRSLFCGRIRKIGIALLRGRGGGYTYAKNQKHKKHAIYWNFIIIIIIVYWDAKNIFFFQKLIKFTDRAPIKCLFREIMWELIYSQNAKTEAIAIELITYHFVSRPLYTIRILQCDFFSVVIPGIYKKRRKGTKWCSDVQVET